jgi:hypothetical protein
VMGYLGVMGYHGVRVSPLYVRIAGLDTAPSSSKYPIAGFGFFLPILMPMPLALIISGIPTVKGLASMLPPLGFLIFSGYFRGLMVQFCLGNALIALPELIA